MYKNVASQSLVVFAWDTVAGTFKTGDAANITCYKTLDGGTPTILSDTSATEIDSTNAKGAYAFSLSQAETNADIITFTGKSSTANIIILPLTVHTMPAWMQNVLVDGSGFVTAKLANDQDVRNVAGTISDKTGYALTAAYDAAKTAASQSSVSALPSASAIATAVWGAASSLASLVQSVWEYATRTLSTDISVDESAIAQAVVDAFQTGDSGPIIITTGWIVDRCKIIVAEREPTEGRQIVSDTDFNSAVVGAILEYGRQFPYTKTIRYRLNRGAFASSTVYDLNDIVSHSGVTYQCILAYTSTSTTPDSDTTHWIALTHGTYEFKLPTDWQTDCSQILQIEYPGDEQDPDYMESNEYLVMNGYWRLRSGSVSAGQTAYMTYSLLHSESTIQVGHKEAVATLAAANVCLELAAKFARTESPRIAADTVNYRTKSDEWRSLAKDLRAKAFQALGIAMDPTKAGSSQVAAGGSVEMEFPRP